jgi:hypothetical protein
MLVGARIGMIWAKKPPPLQVATEKRPFHALNDLERLLMSRVRRNEYLASLDPCPVRIMDELGVATVNFLKIDCEGSEYEVLRSLDAAPPQWVSPPLPDGRAATTVATASV